MVPVKSFQAMMWMVLKRPAKPVDSFSKLMIGAKLQWQMQPRSFNKGVLERWLCLIRGAEGGMIIETLTPES